MSISVLVADDQEIVRTGLTMILNAQPDVEVIGQAADGQQAVELAQKLRPDVCLLDVRMPVLDGIEATRRLAGPGVEAAIYRIAQESITNAVRHARRATRVDVSVTGEDDRVRLTVRDDGDASPTGRSWAGYGLVGMAERATLRGGTLEAGPGPDGGWTVTALLPREISPR